jgi:hypothetical protein
MAAKMHFVFVKTTKHAFGAATAVQAADEAPPPAELVGAGLAIRDPATGLVLFSIKPDDLAVATVEPIADGLSRPTAFDVPDDKSPQLRAASTTLTLAGTTDNLRITASATVPRGTKMLVQVFNRASGERQESTADSPDPAATVIDIPFNLTTGLKYDVLALIKGAVPKLQEITVA